MRYLLDTHILLWWLTEPEKLEDKIQHLISNRKNKIYISSVSIWEMAIKKDLGKLNIPVNLLDIIKKESFEILNLSAEESLAVVDLPKIHNDPFDRLLIAQCKYNNLIFITKDKNIVQYPVDCFK